MIKLKKSKSTVWHGNGLGSSSAEWIVASEPSISVKQLGGSWYAIKDGNRIARGYDKKMLLQILADKMPALDK